MEKLKCVLSFSWFKYSPIISPLGPTGPGNGLPISFPTAKKPKGMLIFPLVYTLSSNILNA